MNPTTQIPKWVIDTYYGLFRPGRQLTIAAATQFSAECTATALLAPDEWFPTMSAARLVPNQVSLGTLEPVAMTVRS
ncbi:MAG: hypothetical protein J0I18_11365 [Actinobacteria bacterium]|nr:hypothetical protein [Actinomycetota bacterium]